MMGLGLKGRLGLYSVAVTQSCARGAQSFAEKY